MSTIQNGLKILTENTSLEFNSSSSSDGSNQPRTSTPIKNSRGDILAERDRKFAKLAKDISDLDLQVNDSDILTDEMLERITKSLSRARSSLGQARNLAGLSKSSEESNLDPALIKPDHSSASTSSSHPQEEHEGMHYPSHNSEGSSLEKEQPEPGFKPIPKPRTKVRDSDSLEWDNFDLQEKEVEPSLDEEVDQQQKIDAQKVTKWLDEKYVDDEPPPIVTRSGRQIRRPVMFDPSDEITREKHLREAHKKQFKVPNVPEKQAETHAEEKSEDPVDIEPGASGLQRPMSEEARQEHFIRTHQHATRQSLNKAYTEAVAQSRAEKHQKAQSEAEARARLRAETKAYVQNLDQSSEDKQTRTTGKASSKLRPKSSKK
jgi:hypothetical protein